MIQVRSLSGKGDDESIGWSMLHAHLSIRLYIYISIILMRHYMSELYVKFSADVLF